LLYNQDGVPQFHTDGTELYELCGTCGSVGVTSCQSFPCEHGGHTCTACGGRGYTLDPERLEAAPAGMYPPPARPNSNARRLAKQTILAYLGEPR
jgi:hypothetical protein